MSGAPHPANENERIRSLHALEILDTEPEERFDRLTKLARRLFDVPIALVSLVDTDRQWFKSRIGMEARETPREYSFCAHAILEDEVMVVSDATEDERFRENPLVCGVPEIRFYAGCPVRGPDGHPLGTLCVIGHEPRTFDTEEEALLRDLADLVERELRSEELATMDPLTGVTNRRGFYSIAAHALAMCRRMDRPATLLFLDLNDFKTINDTRGHLEGDRVLQEFASCLLTTFRDSDVVARLGGDEFCVLLSGATEDQVSGPLELLGECSSGGDAGPGVTFSVGVAGFDPETHQAVTDLVEDADARMYRDKRG